MKASWISWPSVIEGDHVDHPPLTELRPRLFATPAASIQHNTFCHDLTPMHSRRMQDDRSQADLSDCLADFLFCGLPHSPTPRNADEQQYATPTSATNATTTIKRMVLLCGKAASYLWDQTCSLAFSSVHGCTMLTAVRLAWICHLAAAIVSISLAPDI